MNRRHLLKSGLAITAGSLLPANNTAVAAISDDDADALPVAFTEPRRWLMDFDWRFHLGHASDPEQDFNFGGSSRESTFAKADRMTPVTELAFDDKAWRSVRLPHDWAVELPFVQGKNIAPHGSRPLGREYPETSVGWYRRYFNIASSDADQRFSIDMDGVFRDAMIFLNGHFLARNASGYAPFTLDVTDYLNFGGKNVLTLRVDASLGEGWFYEGAGIYRHVWLRRQSPLLIVHDGVFVTTEKLRTDAAVDIKCEVQNNHSTGIDCRLEHRILDAQDHEVQLLRSETITVEHGETARFETKGLLRAPQLWSLESPHRYRLVSTLYSRDGRVADIASTHFGVRTLKFDFENGFFLNGNPVKIKGTCNHQDHAGVGTALPDFLHRYRIDRLQECGSNACRSSHNPATSEFLEECDRQGMLVMAEVRMMASTSEGLSQMERMVRRDRNRPSIILWSLGNEEPEQGADRAARIVRSMKEHLRKLDPSRLVTVAMNGGWGKGVSDVVDIQGCNYNRGLIDGFHRQFPFKPMIGTETASTLSTRDEYITDPKKGVVSAYDVNPPSYGDTAEQWWQLYDARSFLSGGFVWTGFDYRGEPNPYVDVSVSSQFGILDMCGFPKDTFYYYKAWWGAEPVLHLFPHWNWKAGETVQVWCHSNLDTVELLLNGISQGEKAVPRLGHVTWDVPFAPGAIEARGRKNGKQVRVNHRTTSGQPAAILLSSDRTILRADGEDGCVISVAVVDGSGVVVPDASNDIAFKLNGPGEIIGVGNGDPNSKEGDKASNRSAFHGLCCAIVQTGREPGLVRLTASSPGLKEASIELHSDRAVGRDVGV
jgi:beta-galactosidase